MRNSWVAPTAVLAAGVVGAFLRRLELRFAFEETSGLAVKGDPAAGALIVVSAAIFAAIVVFSVLAVKKDAAPNIYRRAFYNGSILSFMFSALFGAVIILCSALFFIKPADIGISGITFTVFSAFSLLSGLSVIVLASGGFTQKERGAEVLFSVIPAVFFCFWLAVVYRDYAACPTLSKYAYRCLALAFSALAFYYGAGYAFGRVKVKMTVVSHLTAVYFICVTLADDWTLMQKGILAATLGFLLQNTSRFLKAIKPQK